MEVVTCARSVDIEAYILSFAPALRCLSVLCLYLSECSDRPAHPVVKGRQCYVAQNPATSQPHNSHGDRNIEK
jgi:hypothetical protein